jgi:hypothetical protein
LHALGHEVDVLDAERIVIPYEIPVGKFAGTKIKLGFVVQDHFPANPPASGPHISPRLLAINKESKAHPEGGVHESEQFGPEWQYWSRPHNDWAKTDRSAKAYMAFIRLLFEKQ